MWFCSQANYPLLFLSSFLTFPVRHEPNCHSADSKVHAEKVLFARRKLQFCRHAEFCENFLAVYWSCQQGWQGGRNLTVTVDRIRATARKALHLLARGGISRHESGK